MAAGTKIAAFGAILRIYYVAFGSERWTWQPMLWIIAILTMVVGAVLAVVQTDMKRMLAYSSIAHTGFLLTGVLGVQAASELSDGQVTSMQAVLFYLTTYGFAMIGAFAVVTLVRDSGGEASQFQRWAGIGRRSPLIGGLFAFFLLSMAGIPLTAGFVGKWAVFTVALSAGAWPVVIAAILCSIVAVFFYVRVIVLMFFTEGEGEVASVTRPSLLTSATILIGVAATLVLGIVPGPVLTLAGHAGQFVR
jgi:NADH-quinone oxidoreductase subunit N